MTYYDRRNDRRHNIAILIMIVSALAILWATPADAQVRAPRPPQPTTQRRVITPAGGRMNDYRWRACLDSPADCPTVVSATPTPRPRRR